MPHPFILEYGDLIDDHAAFAEALARPLEPCFWINPMKATSSDPVLELLEESFSPRPFNWKKGAYRCRKGSEQIGHTIPFFCGWVYVQEEVAQTAVAALNPQPGEHVADLCASPGGKTAAIACAVGREGTVLAVEPNPYRLAGLGNTIERLGLINVSVFEHDGQSVPLWFGPFDRVLVDAPCSSEGTIRKIGGRMKASIDGFREQLTALQSRILKRGLALLKPGGTLVYSTCTINPFENEGVLSASLSEGDRIVPIDLPGLHSEAGVPRWKGASFRADVIHAKRFLPHHNDTGGFFIAKVVKASDVSRADDTEASHWRSGAWHTPERVAKAKGHILNPLEEVNVTRVASWFKNQFDSDLPSDLRLFRKGGEQVWATTVSPPPHPHFRSAGIPLVKLTARSEVPTSAATQLFGSSGGPQIMLDQAEALAFAQGKCLPLRELPVRTFINARFGPYALGYARVSKDGIHPQVPKGYKIHDTEIQPEGPNLR
jgi:16S rRNA C967 or C1407 C5-methylase (RsmB/RsmF family)